MSTQHIPTVDQIIDALNVRIESDEPGPSEREALTRAAAVLEGERARQSRISGLAVIAEGLILERITGHKQERAA